MFSACVPPVTAACGVTQKRCKGKEKLFADLEDVNVEPSAELCGGFDIVANTHHVGRNFKGLRPLRLNS